MSGLEAPVALVPGTTEYEVALGVLMESVTLTATAASPGDTLVIAGEPVADGVPSQALAMAVGDNTVDIVVENGRGEQATGIDGDQTNPTESGASSGAVYIFH